MVKQINLKSKLSLASLWPSDPGSDINPQCISYVI